MQYFSGAVISSLVLLVGFSGCIPSDPEDPTNLEILMSEATPGQLVAEFIEMANEPEKWTDDFRRIVIVKQLSAMGPSTLTPLINLMASPNSSPETRLFILQSLADRVSPLYLRDLAPLISSEDPVLRACVITLIGHMDHPDVIKLLELAENDVDSRVSFSALSGKAIQGDPVAREKLLGMYFDPTTRVLHKREVIRVILRTTQMSDLDILLSALDEDFLYIKTRALVAEVLGHIGDESALEPLERSLSLYEDPIFIKLASAAIEEIKQSTAEVTDGQ